VRRLLTGIAGGFGIAGVWRLLGRRRPVVKQPGGELPGAELPAADPAEELRHKLAEARGSGDDRDEFDAAEGTPVDEAEAPAPGRPGPLDKRRRAVHEQAQEALGRMRQDPED